MQNVGGVNVLEASEVEEGRLMFLPQSEVQEGKLVEAT